MSDHCPACGQTVFEDFEVTVILPEPLREHAKALEGQLERRRSIFEAIDRYLGYELVARLEQDDDFLPRLTATFQAVSECLDQYRAAKVATAAQNNKRAVEHGNLMAENLLQIAGECVWMIAEYGYPLAENVPALLRRLRAEDDEVGK